jgi:hypothetical protein
MTTVTKLHIKIDEHMRDAFNSGTETHMKIVGDVHNGEVWFGNQKYGRIVRDSEDSDFSLDVNLSAVH